MEVDCWDSAYEIGQWKFVRLGGSPVRFLDGESSDWSAWKKSSNGVPQSFIIGPTDYCYLSKLGYGGNYNEFIEVFETLVYGDDEAPYVTNLNPNDGAVVENLKTNVTGHIVDDNYGVDEDSVDVIVTQPYRSEIPGTLNLTGNFLDLTYTFNPDEDLPHYTEITVSVSAEDLATPPNALDYEYSFTTRSFKLEEPDDDEVINVLGGGEPVDAEVTFEWEEVVRADEYELLVDDDDGFGSPDVDVTGITEPTYTHTFTVGEDITYYWRVIANCPDSDFACKEDFSFTFDYIDNTNITPASLGVIKATYSE